MRVGRQAVDRAALEARERDDPVDLDPLAGGPQLERAVAALLGVDAGVQVDAGLLEQVDQRLRRLRAEHGQRRVLGRDDVQLGREVGVIGARRCEQRELVDRQAPGDPGRDDERDAAGVAALDVLDEAVHGLGVARSPEGGRALERRLGARAERDEQGVLAELSAAGGAHGVRSGSTDSSRSTTRSAPRSRAIASSG